MAPRRRKAIVAGLVVASVAVVAALAYAPRERPSPGHRPLHIGCPPGSHGKPRFDGVGAALQRARDQIRQADDLSSRSLTAQHPRTPD